jgi:hypothetical protein
MSEVKHPTYPAEAILAGQKPTGELRWVKDGSETVLQQKWTLYWRFENDVRLWGEWANTDQTTEWIDTPFYTKP